MDEQANDNEAVDARNQEPIPPDSSTGEHTEALVPPVAETVASPPAPAEEHGEQVSPDVSWRPADYYAAPRAPSRFPKWVPLAFGVAAIAAIGLMLIIGVFLQSGGLAKFVAIAFGQMSSDAERMFDDGVTPDVRASFKESLLAVRDGIADGSIELSAALPLLQEMQTATKDRRLSLDEVEGLTTMFEESMTPATGGDPSEPRTVDL